MTRSRILVTYYSRTGNTAQLAEEIASTLRNRGAGCELERLRERDINRSGWIGYLRSGFDAIFQRSTELEPLVRDPAQYDLVIVGTPVWNASISTPARAFLLHERHRLRRVAFFATHGGSGEKRVFSRMREITRQAPVATLVVRERDLPRHKHVTALQGFIDHVLGAVGARTPDAEVAVHGL